MWKKCWTSAMARSVQNAPSKAAMKSSNPPTPALLTVIDSNDPRPQHARLLMKFKRAKTPSEIKAEGGDDAAIEAAKAKGLLIGEWAAADFIPADEMDRVGKKGSPTNVKQIQSVILTAKDYKKVEPTADGVAGLIHELIADHTLG